MTKPDTPLDDVERAHLVDPTDTTYAIDRFAPSPDVVDLVRRHWVPMWHLPEGESSEQAVLQYPVCLVVVAHDNTPAHQPRARRQASARLTR